MIKYIVGEGHYVQHWKRGKLTFCEGCQCIGFWGALVFFKVIHQISRSQGTKRRRFWPELSVSGLKFDLTGFGMMHKAWCDIEEVPYCFSKSSIKFEGHTG